MPLQRSPGTCSWRRGTFGFKSEELIPFGLNPQRNPTASRRRKKAQADESGKTAKPTEPAAS